MSMDRFLTPEEMYRKRKIKKIVTYVSLITLSVALIVFLQMMLYNM